MSSSDVINIVPETVQDFGACYSRGEINWDSEWGKINKLQGALDSTRGYKINNKWKTDASKQQLDCSLDSVRQRIETATNKYQA